MTDWRTMSPNLLSASVPQELKTTISGYETVLIEQGLAKDLKTLREILQRKDPRNFDRDSSEAIALLKKNQWDPRVLFRAFDVDMYDIVNAANSQTLYNLPNCPYVKVMEYLRQDAGQLWKDFLIVQLIFQNQKEAGKIINLLPLVSSKDGDEISYLDYIAPSPLIADVIKAFAEAIIRTREDDWDRWEIMDYVKRYTENDLDQEEIITSGLRRDEIDKAYAAVLPLYKEYIRQFCSTKDGQELVGKLWDIKPRMGGNKAFEIILRYFTALFS